MSDSSRQLKKHVWGQPHRALLRAASGMIAITHTEVKEILATSAHPDKFGVSTSLDSDGIIITNASIPQLQEILLRTRTARDLLLIVAEGNVKHFSDVRRLLNAVEWHLFFGPSQTGLIKVDSFASRIYHEHAVRDIVQEAVNKTKETGQGTSVDLTIRVTIRRDLFRAYVSLSGLPLYRRQYKATLSAIAPLREDLAACVVDMSCLPATTVKRIDIPFAGSGTLGFEAVLKCLKIAPARTRQDLAMFSFPLFRRDSWNYSIKALEESPSVLNTVDLSDSSLDMFEALSSNVRSFATTYGLSSDRLTFNVASTDFYSTPCHPDTDFFLINPPFGERLDTGANGSVYFRRLAERVIDRYACPGAVLVPSGRDTRAMCSVLGRRVVGCQDLKSGGLSLSLLGLAASRFASLRKLRSFNETSPSLGE